MLLRTWVFKYLFETLFSDLSDICPEGEMLDHKVILFLSFWGTATFFSAAAAPYSHHIPTTAQVFQFLYILSNTYYVLFLLLFLIVAILMDVRCFIITRSTKTFFPGAHGIYLLLPKVWSVDQQHGHHPGVFDAEPQPPPQPFRVRLCILIRCQVSLTSTVLSAVGALRRVSYSEECEPHLSSALNKMRHCWVKHAGVFLSLMDVWHIHCLPQKQT